MVNQVYRLARHSLLRTRRPPIRFKSTLAVTPDLVKSKKEEETKPKVTTDSISKLFQFSKPEWPLVGASAATLGVTSSITLLLPYASGQVIDITMATDPSGSSPITLAAGLFGLMAVSGAGVYFRTLWLARAGNRIVARLRQRTYQKMLEQDVAYISKRSTGDFLSRLSADSQLIQSTVTTQAVAALRTVVMSTGSACMLLYTSPTLAAVSLSTLPPIFITARHVGRQLQKQQQKVQELQAEATSLAEQALSGVVTVKHFNAEGYETLQYSQAIAKAHRTSLATAHMQAQLEAVTYTAANGAVLGVLGYGGTLVMDNILTAGDLAGFVMYSFLMAGNLSAMSSIYADMSRAVAASDRVMEIVEREPETPAPSNITNMAAVTQDPLYPPEKWVPATSAAFSPEPLSVRIQNLSFQYPSRPDTRVLENLDLSLEPGKVLSLVGGSGSGKSTVAGLLTRLYEVPRGTILIDSVDILDMAPDDLRQQIGIVSQEPILFSGSIADNIRYGKWDANDDEVYEAAEMAHVLDFSDNLPQGLETMIGSKQLSGGQKQRVAIARMILKDPRLVILDEAYSALDARSEHLVQAAMTTILNSNKTVLSIAHRLSTIRHSDSIAVLQDGRVVQQGSFSELQQDRNGPFWNLMKTQLFDEQ